MTNKTNLGKKMYFYPSLVAKFKSMSSAIFLSYLLFKLDAVYLDYVELTDATILQDTGLNKNDLSRAKMKLFSLDLVIIRDQEFATASQYRVCMDELATLIK